jgi:phosphoribosyl-AMP cyclohydrolase
MAESLQWDFFPYLPVVLQDASTKDVLMVQYMTQEGVQRTLEERSTWLWSRSRERFWLAGREGGGHDVREMRSTAWAIACSPSWTPRAKEFATSGTGAASPTIS